MASGQTSSVRGLLDRTGFGSKRSFRFLAVAVGWMVVLYGAYYYPYGADSPVMHGIETYLRLQAQGAAALIRLFDSSASVRDTVIDGRFPVQIVKSCSSLDAQALYAAAVLAFPAHYRVKAVGLVAGLVGLTALNLARIATLYFVGALAPAAFDAVHEEVLPLLLVAYATGSFALWARWANRDATPRTV